MPHAIIRSNNGRCHEVHFDGTPIRIEAHASKQVLEFSIMALENPVPSNKNDFALLNLPRHLFSEAMGEVARRSGKRNKDYIKAK